MSKAPAIRPPTAIAKSAFLFPDCIISVVRRRPLYWHAIGQEAQKPGPRHRRENQKSAARCPKSDRFLMHHKRLTIESDVRDQRSEIRGPRTDIRDQTILSLSELDVFPADDHPGQAPEPLLIRQFETGNAPQNKKEPSSFATTGSLFQEYARARRRYSYGAASWAVRDL